MQLFARKLILRHAEFVEDYLIVLNLKGNN
jgi:hypothetical protein